MRATTAIVTILTIVVSVSASVKDHPLDEAGQWLSSGDLKRAIEGYQRANGEGATCAGYNNLGVACERAGRFEDAHAAYQRAVQIADDVKEVQVNSIRARTRAAIRKWRPYGALIVFGLSAVFTLTRLARTIILFWLQMRRAMRLREVKVTNLSHSIQCYGADCQPDGKIYPDSEKIVVRADLLVPGDRELYPLRFKLELIQPDGGSWRSLQDTIGSAEAREASICFQVDELSELLERPGLWKARLIIEQIPKTLSEIDLTVVSQADLIADLEATDSKLIAVCGNSNVPDNVVFSDVEAVVPHSVISCRQCHPTKFVGKQLRLDLVNVDNGDEAESQWVPLDLTDGRMQFCSISRPIANDAIAQKNGLWEFRLFIEGRLLAQIPFTITTFEQALKSIGVESFEIAGRTATGQIQRLGEAVDPSKLRSLTPIITLSTDFPSRRVRYPMILAACINGQPIGAIESKLVMNRDSGQLIPGELPMPPVANGRPPMKLSFALIIGGRFLGERSIVLRKHLARSADSQGRIGNSPSADELDFDSEAAEILSGAQVVGTG